MVVWGGGGGGGEALAVFEAPGGAVRFWRGRVNCMIHYLRLDINRASSRHLPDSNASSCGGHLQFQKLSTAVILLCYSTGALTPTTTTTTLTLYLPHPSLSLT